MDLGGHQTDSRPPLPTLPSPRYGDFVCLNQTNMSARISGFSGISSNKDDLMDVFVLW